MSAEAKLTCALCEKCRLHGALLGDTVGAASQHRLGGDTSLIVVEN